MYSVIPKLVLVLLIIIYAQIASADDSGLAVQSSVNNDLLNPFSAELTMGNSERLLPVSETSGVWDFVFTSGDAALKGVLSILVVLLSVYLSYSRYSRARTVARQNRKIAELQKHAFESQKDMIYVMGEAIECRSGETGHHVKRVANLSRFIARLYGLSDQECEIMHVISPMHDIGKIAIPEKVLDKPGKLTPGEFEVMKTHTSAGYELLSASSGHLMNMAAVVAYEHHEKWDGTGYPNGKSGEDIHIYARITAVADVLDALLSERPYKKAWPEYKVLQFIEDESGKHFQPELSELVIANFRDIINIRNISAVETEQRADINLNLFPQYQAASRNRC